MTGHPRNKSSKPGRRPPERAAYPFAAIVGQGEMKLALLLNAIAPAVGGVLIMGERGTAKSTAVRALAALLPPLKAVRGCPYNCDPQDAETLCRDCRATLEEAGKLAAGRTPVPLVELPLNATEDRVCGTLDVESVLREGVRAFEPGLLARSNRGFLYVDEVNLLEDHLVDVLLDVSVTGTNRVEREGVSLEHPSRFVLVGSGNPEEGELRPQLLDRFGLFTEVVTAREVDDRMEIVERCERFAADPARFVEGFAGEQESLRRRLTRARRAYASVRIGRPLLRQVAEMCQSLGVDGHRGELTVVRAARALAAFEGRREVSAVDVRRVASMALRHRLRRDPLEQTQGGARIERALEETLGEAAHADADAKASTRRSADGRGRNAEEADPLKDDSRAGTRGKGNGGGGDGGDGDGGDGGATRTAETVVPPAGARLPVGDFEQMPSRARSGGKASPKSRRGLAGKSVDGVRGRYAGASKADTGGGVLALDATLREYARRAGGPGGLDACGAPGVLAADLRFKRFKGRAGTLFIFAVDTSGSMAANRIGQAKGAVADLLRKSYVRRDRVALVCFRERGGEVMLRPTGAIARANRILEALPVGGATPLTAGLQRSLEVALKAAAEGTRRVVLILFTDGRANVSLGGHVIRERASARAQILAEVRGIGAALRRAGVSSLVVDTASRFTSGGEAAELASALGGGYVPLPPGASRNNLHEALNA